MKKVPSLPQTLLPGLQILAIAHSYAEKTKRPAWDYAIDIGELHAVGCTHNDLRCLLALGLAERKMAIQGNGKRRFGKNQGQSFTNRCCFVLTDLGKAVARRLHLKETVKGRDMVPQWDEKNHELRADMLIIKKFKKPAPTQALILSAFNEQKWPREIDDPLPPHHNMNSKRRLRQTITNLNRRLRLPLIHFFGDGTGQKVGWEWRE